MYTEYTRKDKTLKWQKYLHRNRAGFSTPFLTPLTTAGSEELLDINDAKMSCTLTVSLLKFILSLICCLRFDVSYNLYISQVNLAFC